jgi:hypothetical protein
MELRGMNVIFAAVRYSHVSEWYVQAIEAHDDDAGEEDDEKKIFTRMCVLFDDLRACLGAECVPACRDESERARERSCDAVAWSNPRSNDQGPPSYCACAGDRYAT